ncbi:MAG TPA: OmpA family protein [Burkholderiaceae bacterium]|nr:OmpA family protein [Burkholderiaceae bacterium]
MKHLTSSLGRSFLKWVIAPLVFFSATVTVSAQSGGSDLAGAKDHPLIKRYANSGIVLYDTKRFDSVEFQTSTFAKFNLTTRQREFVAAPIVAEGERTRIWYEAPGDVTSLEVFRNYVNELQASGFTILYDSSKDRQAGRWNGFLNVFGFGGTRLATSRSEFVMYGAAQKNVYTLTAKRDKDGQTTYTQLTVVQWDNENRIYKAQRGVYAALDIVDVAAMKQNMITVSASEMSKAMTSTGRVALYGILFDTGKAELKPESKPALEEIAKLLKAENNLKLRVVGHTDNQGGLDSNISLSKRRAESVNAALASQYGIASSRLSAFGVADLAPVATNATEEGRAKNRRVELVPQ